MYTERLEQASARLNLIDASLKLSYDLLSEARQAEWRRLAVFPATFDTEAAAAVWSVGIEAAEEALGQLIRYSMVEFDESSRRYHLHEMARVFAGARLTEDERSVARKQHAAHYLRVVSECNSLYKQGGESVTQGLELFEVMHHRFCKFAGPVVGNRPRGYPHGDYDIPEGGFPCGSASTAYSHRASLGTAQ